MSGAVHWRADLTCPSCGTVFSGTADTPGEATGKAVAEVPVKCLDATSHLRLARVDPARRAILDRQREFAR